MTPLERRILLSATSLEPEVTELNNPDLNAKSVHDTLNDLNALLTEYSSDNPFQIQSNYCFDLINMWWFDTSELSNSEEDAGNAVHAQPKDELGSATSSPSPERNSEFDQFRIIGDCESEVASYDANPSGSSRQLFELGVIDPTALELWSSKTEEYAGIFLSSYLLIHLP